MKNEKMLRVIGQIDDDLIEDAVIQATKVKKPFYRRFAFRGAAAIVACFVLVIGLVLSVRTLSKWNNEAPDIMPTSPNLVHPDEPVILLPPSLQKEDQQININGIDKLNYYAALRMVSEVPGPVHLSATDSSCGISLLTTGYNAATKDRIITLQEETQGPPVSSNPPMPPVDDEDIYYYAMEPDQPFYINKVSIFQIELTDENGFLASRLGLGIADVVITEDCVWGDSLIVFRNGDRFFSCLSNGWSLKRENGGCQWDFSTHKYVEGFFIVKNFEQENYAFYIDMSAEGQAVAFDCQGAQNGGYHPDQNVKVVSSTVISTEGRSFTAAELEEYFNASEFSEELTPPEKPTPNL